LGTDDSVGDPLDPKVQRLLDVLGRAGFTGVAGEVETGRTGGFEGRSMGGHREARLIARQVEADHAPAGKAARLARQRNVVFRRVLAHGADDGHCAQWRRLEAAEDGADDLGHREAAAKVQPRRPAHLQVIDVLLRGVHAQLVCDPFQRRLGLEDGDRVVEIADVLGLGGAVVGRDQAQWPG
jgi:hypothetical protein